MSTSDVKTLKNFPGSDLLLGNDGESVSLITENVQVAVLPQFIETRIENGELCFCFSYQISLTNLNDFTIELMDRHWIVMSGDEKFAEVKGLGVVGKFPVLDPGETFTYVSGTLIAQPIGSMEGSYRFQVSDSDEILTVTIPRFKLVCDTMVH